MEQSRRRKFALLLVIERKDGTIKQHTIGSALLELILGVFFVAVVAAVCKFVYDGIVIKDARKEIVTQIVMINNLTDENEALSVENSTLSNKVAVLSETVSKKIGRASCRERVCLYV